MKILFSRYYYLCWCNQLLIFLSLWDTGKKAYPSLIWVSFIFNNAIYVTFLFLSIFSLTNYLLKFFFFCSICVMLSFIYWLWEVPHTLKSNFSLQFMICKFVTRHLLLLKNASRIVLIKKTRDKRSSEKFINREFINKKCKNDNWKDCEMVSEKRRNLSNFTIKWQ